MLVLSRKVNEEIRIGENITVKILRNANGTVRLGVTAPQNVPIVRTELTDDSEPTRKAA